MSNNNLLWHWGKKGNDLPSWVDDSLFTGTFTHPILPTGAVSNGRGTTRCGKVTNGFMKALIRAKQILNNADMDGFGCNNDYSIAELTLTAAWDDLSSTVGIGETICVAYNKKDGDFWVSKSGASYNVGKGTSAPFFLAIIADMYYESTEFALALDNFAAESDDENKRAYACFIADLVYIATSGASPSYKIPDTSAVKNLSRTKMSTPALRPIEFVGNFQNFAVTRGKGAGKRKNKVSSVMPTEKFVDSYIFSSEKLDERQEKLVPIIDDKFIVGQTLVNICNHIKASTNRPRPIRNILLRGAPGAGKTEMYVGIAAGCHLPLYRFAANAMTERATCFATSL